MGTGDKQEQNNPRGRFSRAGADNVKSLTVQAVIRCGAEHGSRSFAQHETPLGAELGIRRVCHLCIDLRGYVP